MFYDSVADAKVVGRVENPMKAFFEEYCQCFHGYYEDGLTFEVMEIAQQNDGWSCGVYTVQNCLKLLSGKGPVQNIWDVLHLLDIGKQYTKVMVEAKRKQDEEKTIVSEMYAWVDE